MTHQNLLPSYARALHHSSTQSSSLIALDNTSTQDIEPWEKQPKSSVSIVHENLYHKTLSRKDKHIISFLKIEFKTHMTTNTPPNITNCLIGQNGHSQDLHLLKHNTLWRGQQYGIAIPVLERTENIEETRNQTNGQKPLTLKDLWEDSFSEKRVTKAEVMLDPLILMTKNSMELVLCGSTTNIRYHLCLFSTCCFCAEKWTWLYNWPGTWVSCGCSTFLIGSLLNTKKCQLEYYIYAVYSSCFCPLRMWAGNKKDTQE